MEKKDVATIIKIRWWNSFVFRFVALTTSVVLVLFFLLLVTTHTSSRNHVAERFSSVLKTVVTNGAPLINGADLRTIETNADVQTPEFKRVRNVLEKLRNQNELANDGIYILKADNKKDGVYRFVAMLQRKTFVGDKYSPPPHIHKLYMKALSGNSVQSPIYEDAHGSFISGVAPIRDSSGSIVALLQADIRLARYLKAIDGETQQIFLIGLAVLAGILLLGSYMRRQLSTRITELMKGTIALNQSDFSARIALATNDELGELGKSINVALEHLQERAEMLKFLPDHTQKMIVRVLEGGASQVELTEARNVNVAVLETDIRGFTALSEKLEPSETIALINRYISLQAEKILQYDGSIDKYMGDAVLVVFEGSDAPTRAFACARDILGAVTTLNQSADMPVWIGAGVTFGPVVMGNMGCDARMEHTVIGPTVNLAARLCSAAKPRELVVQKSLMESALRTEPTAFNEIEYEVEQIACKGFSSKISVCRLTV